MATVHPASAYTKGQRVKVELKSSGSVYATVKKILADEDKLLIVPEDGQARAGEALTISAGRISKVRGPLPGTKRTPKAKVETASEDDDEDGDDTVTQTSGGTITMSIADAEEFLSAFGEMGTRFEALIKAAKKASPKAAAAKPGLMKGAKKRPAAEDDDED